MITVPARWTCQRIAITTSPSAGSLLGGSCMKHLPQPRGFRRASSTLLLVVTLSAAAAPTATVPGRAVYKDPSAPVEARVEDLLARMTLEEKIAQITTIWTKKDSLLTAAG